MIDLSKLAHIPYKNYLISKALHLAVDSMKKEGDPNEIREIQFMQNLIEVEYPMYGASKADTKEDAIDILTKHMDLVDIDENGNRIFRSRDEDIHG